MGKLVLGIIVVALLEIAFIGFAAINGTENAVIAEVSGPFVKGLELARVDKIPEFLSPLPEIDGPKQSNLRFVDATGRSRAGTRSYRKARRSEGFDTWSTDFAPTTTVIRTGRGIPIGYTMVLADYSPDVSINGKPKITYFNSKPKAKSSSYNKPATISYSYTATRATTNTPVPANRSSLE